MSILLALVYLLAGYPIRDVARAIMRDFQILIFKDGPVFGKEQEQNQELGKFPDYSQEMNWD